MVDNHIYRNYVCNIKAPNLKCRKLYCDEIVCDENTTSQILTYEGSGTYQYTHTITSAELPILAKKDWSGEMTIFLSNVPATLQHIMMCVIQNTTGKATSAIAYQSVGNFTTATITSTGTTSIVGNIVIKTASPSIMRWRFIGC